jgi:hypothetical protein
MFVGQEPSSMSLPAGKFILVAPAIQPSGDPGPLAFGVTFACLVAPHSVLVLLYGLTGSSGNSLVTGAFLVIATVATGLLCLRRDIALTRYDQARLFADYAIERSPGEIGLEKPSSCYLTVNLRNSIAIRKALVQDALFLTPTSGWIGTGLDSFMKFSCIKLTEVHNSVLQPAVGLKDTARAPASARSAVVA